MSSHETDGSKLYCSFEEVVAALQVETDKQSGEHLYDLRWSAFGTGLHISKMLYLQVTHGNRSNDALEFVEHIFTSFDLSKVRPAVVEFVKAFKAASLEARMAFYELDAKYAGERRPGAFE